MRNGFEDLDLDRLRRRRSEKWRLHPPDVLPAFIAEMDYDLAEPVLAALRAAVDLSDCGYPALGGIGETFAAFAAARHGWTVDPGRVHLVPDVMAGVDAILALGTEPGDGVVINTPVYPPFFKHIGFAGRRVVEVPLVPVGGRWELDFAGRGRGGGFRGHGAAARPAACLVPVRGRAFRRAGLAGRLEFGRGLAGRAARAARPGADRLRPAARRAAAGGLVHPAGGELPGLGGLRRARPRPGTRPGVPGSGPGSPRPRA